MISNGNHVKFAPFVLLAVSEEAKTWLPSLLRWPSKTLKKYLKTRTHKHKEVDEGGKKAVLLITWKRKKLREPEKKNELAQTLKTFYVVARKKGFVQCIIKRLLDSVFVISRIITVSVRVISRSLRLWLIISTSTLTILDITKTSSNNCLTMPYVDFNILHMIDLVTLDRWKLSEKSRSLFCSSQLLNDDLIACDSCWSIQGYIKWFRDVLNIGRQKQNTRKQALYAVLDHKHCGLAHDRRTRVAKVLCNFSRQNVFYSQWRPKRLWLSALPKMWRTGYSGSKGQNTFQNPKHFP